MLSLLEKAFVMFLAFDIPFICILRNRSSSLSVFAFLENCAGIVFTPDNLFIPYFRNRSYSETSLRFFLCNALFYVPSNSSCICLGKQSNSFLNLLLSRRHFSLNLNIFWHISKIGIFNLFVFLKLSQCYMQNPILYPSFHHFISSSFSFCVLVKCESHSRLTTLHKPFTFT